MISSAHILSVIRSLRRRTGGAVAALAVMALASASCSDGDRGPASGSTLPAKDVYLSLTLAAGSESAAAAAADNALTWGDEYAGEDGSAAESAFDPARMCMILRQQGKSPVRLTTGPGDYDLKAYGDNRGFRLFCNLDRLIEQGRIDVGKTVDIEVYANTRAEVDPDRTDELSFAYADVVNGQYLPMFGFSKGAGPLEAGVINDAGSIDMLRAVAKVELLVDPAADRNYVFNPQQPPVIVDGMALVPHTGRQTPLRAKWNARLRTRELTFDDSANPVLPSAGASGNIVMTQRRPDGRGYDIYLPETRSAEGNTLPLRIDVSLCVDNDDDTDNNLSYSGSLYFADYDPETLRPAEGSDLTQFHLERNHIYRFSILRATSDINLRYEVVDAGNQEIQVPDYE